MTTPQYDPIAKTLHWMMAGAIVLMIGMGLYMVTLPPSMRAFRFYDFHKAVGLSLLVLALLRLLWRWYRPAPAMLTSGAKTWELHLAHAVHIALYALMFVIPVIGWLGASASGLPMTFFGFFAIPGLMESNETVQGFALGLHGWLNWLFILAIVLHVAGALKRHFVMRDDTLRRMLPFAKISNKD